MYYVLVDNGRVTVVHVGRLVLWSASRIVSAFISTWSVNMNDKSILMARATELTGSHWSFSYIDKLLFLFLVEHFAFCQRPTGMLRFYVWRWLWWRLSNHGMALLCSKWCCYRWGIVFFLHATTWMFLHDPAAILLVWLTHLCSYNDISAWYT